MGFVQKNHKVFETKHHLPITDQLSCGKQIPAEIIFRNCIPIHLPAISLQNSIFAFISILSPQMKQHILVLTGYLIPLIFMVSIPVYAQQTPTDPSASEKGIEHADPVFNDFNTDLGAKKGTGQINVNFGYGNLTQDHHELLSQLELEYAPLDNLGIEVLLPYNVYVNNKLSLVDRPENRLEFLQWSAQYTFLTQVSKGISMAMGFTNTLEMQSPEPQLNREGGFDLESIDYHPYLTFAKNWQDRYFFMFSGGPEFSHDLEQNGLETGAQLNTAFHYGFSDKDHYLGVEFNKEIEEGSLEMYIRLS